MNSLEKMILILTPINTLLGIIISIIQQLSKLSSSTNSFTGVGGVDSLELETSGFVADELE